MGSYTVFGKAVVEISMEIEAESMEDAIKIVNNKGLYIDSFLNSNRIISDEPIEWNYAELTYDS